MQGEPQLDLLRLLRFQNRRTKWKKTENISNAEAAEHKLGTRKMSSTSTSSSVDHHRNAPVQLPTGGSISSKSSTCSSVSSHRSDEPAYNTAAPPPPPTLPLIYFNPFSQLLQSSCSSNAEKLFSTPFDERCCSISTSPESPLTTSENNHCLPSSSSTPVNDPSEEQEEDENAKPQSFLEQRPCSRWGTHFQCKQVCFGVFCLFPFYSSSLFNKYPDVLFYSRREIVFSPPSMLALSRGVPYRVDPIEEMFNPLVTFGRN